MAKLTINPFEEAEQFAQQKGNWIVASVNPDIAWPTRKQIIHYNDVDFLLFPQKENEKPGIAVDLNLYSLEETKVREKILKFCSALSWAESRGIEIIEWHSGSYPRPSITIEGKIATEYLETEHLSEPQTNSESAAIAFYREGLSLNNPFYSFLSLYKAISVILPDGKERGKWIEGALNEIDNHLAIERRDELSQTIKNVGEYLRDEGRNAIAHAGQEPYVNPDELGDHYRMRKDIPLMVNLTELAIESHSSLKKPSTIYSEHLYELQGFKKIIDDELIEKLKNSEPIPSGTTIELPDNFIVATRWKAERHHFQGLFPEIVGQIDGGFILDFVGPEETGLRIRTVLNFLDERLQFDPINGIALIPDRKNEERVKLEITLLKFQRCFLGNGHLEIWDQEQNILIGRSDICMLVNCFVNDEFYDSEIGKLEKLLEQKE